MALAAPTFMWIHRLRTETRIICLDWTEFRFDKLGRWEGACWSSCASNSHSKPSGWAQFELKGKSLLSLLLPQGRRLAVRTAI